MISQYLSYAASFANDGIWHDGIISNGVTSMAHTETEIHPWWRVNLEAVYYVVAVRILNRGLFDNQGRPQYQT